MKLEKPEKVKVESGLVLYQRPSERRRRITLEALGVVLRDKLHFRQRSTFPFLKLPTEIRNKIYALVLPTGPRIIHLEKESRTYRSAKKYERKNGSAEVLRSIELGDDYFSGSRIKTLGTYPLFLVSKQVFLEAVHIFNGQTKLLIEIQHFELVFRVSPYGRMAMAQDMQINFSAPFSQGYDFGNLMPLRMAENLRSLSFSMEPDSIRREHWDSLSTTLRILMTKFNYFTPWAMSTTSHVCGLRLDANATKELLCMEIAGVENGIIQVLWTHVKAPQIGIYTYNYCRQCRFVYELVDLGLIAGKFINSLEDSL